MGLTYLVIGATRGIGLEFVKQLSEDKENKIIGSARHQEQAGELQELADSRENISIVEVEVDNEESIVKLGEQLAKIDGGIDVLIHNAGVLLSAGTGMTLDISREMWLEHYKIDVLGAIEVFQQVYPFLIKKETRKIAFLSSVAGSLSEFLPFPIGAFGQSKAALNYTTKHIAAELESEKFTVLAVHPGAVTAARGDQAFKAFKHILPSEMMDQLRSTAITPEASVKGLLEVISKATVKDSGKFLHHDGSVHDF